uniref:Uncharacterized protein n=1 Tax=Romanomermis culicivorax TaxID=13658 RepID=A0A915JUJ9_ROMCU
MELRQKAKLEIYLILMELRQKAKLESPKEDTNLEGRRLTPHDLDQMCYHQIYALAYKFALESATQWDRVDLPEHNQQMFLGCPVEQDEPVLKQNSNGSSPTDHGIAQECYSE